MGERWPSMKGRDMRRLLVRLCGEPLRQTGSHAIFRSLDQQRTFPFAKHDGEELTPRLVRRILVVDIGLSDEEARYVARKGKRP